MPSVVITSPVVANANLDITVSAAQANVSTIFGVNNATNNVIVLVVAVVTSLLVFVSVTTVSPVLSVNALVLLARTV